LVLIETLEVWLKGTIPGIILLGALGSILAVVLVKAIIYFTGKVIPLPFHLHRKSKAKRAYYLGFMHAQMTRDDTNRRLISFIAFHFILFARSTLLTIILVAAFFTAVLIQPNIYTSFFFIMGAFLSLYWAYNEFEQIYRTYLSHWKSILSSMEDSYLQSETHKRFNKPNKSKQPERL
jgi:hypothetical protein